MRFISFLITNMKNRNYYIIGTLCIVAILGFMPHSEAQESCSDLRRLNREELESCMIESKQKEDDYGTQYQDVAANAALLREQLSASEMELRNLNGLAESERIKQRIILRLQSGFQKPSQNEE